MEAEEGVRMDSVLCVMPCATCVQYAVDVNRHVCSFGKCESMSTLCAYAAF
jgi:hypothetical protein